MHVPSNRSGSVGGLSLGCRSFEVRRSLHQTVGSESSSTPADALEPRNNTNSGDCSMNRSEQPRTGFSYRPEQRRAIQSGPNPEQASAGSSRSVQNRTEPEQDRTRSACLDLKRNLKKPERQTWNRFEQLIQPVKLVGDPAKTLIGSPLTRRLFRFASEKNHSSPKPGPRVGRNNVRTHRRVEPTNVGLQNHWWLRAGEPRSLLDRYDWRVCSAKRQRNSLTERSRPHQ